MAAEKDGVPLPQIYGRERLGRVNNGKNCIRFERLSDVSGDELRNAIRDAIEWSEEQERKYGRNCAVPVEVTKFPAARRPDLLDLTGLRSQLLLADLSGL